jgi:hypothetical protein
MTFSAPTRPVEAAQQTIIAGRSAILPSGASRARPPCWEAGNRKVFFTKAEVIWTWQAPPGDTKDFVWQSGPSAAAAVA